MIKVIVIVLAVVVLSLILTIWGLQRYMVYSSDGGKLELPWAQQTDDGSGSAQPQEMCIRDSPWLAPRTRRRRRRGACPWSPGRSGRR